ncbi:MULTISPECIES: manganese/iron ABC transporter ATP-binding protein [Symbiopectobacterium]|uniref:manganese/iron ABC transporter ATP-binding protein n=1 Tax=Symbiopectobacterium TaxID=801 RepID=UPI001A1B8FAF|nr:MULTISPECIES: manganese/iron ABC transporter ATP-binding protein [Symbiopectobacterium]MBG6247888.1 manganese/iron ABC transporter ATP-binding protein [Candidatus Symbiopectobacterium sp. PLON1]MBT9428486.1 manganese/iron ABC transporter ATP-binding protein [Candidatus Symbiopectobacterium endolongispinus]
MSRTPELALTVDDVSVTYSNGHQAIRNASFSLGGGTICALVGVNGSGKSTLFKSIMGLVKPSSGQVRLNGEAISEALKKNLIAYAPQTEEVDWNFPVLVSDVVMMGRYGKMNFLRIPRQQDRDVINDAMARVGMSALSQRQIGELSGGQKKLVFLARAVAQQGCVLLLDEPFTGVDVKTENAIIDLLRTLRDEGHLILVAIHNLGSVPEFCDSVILVNRTVLAAGPTATTFTQSNLEKTFGGVLRHINLGGEHLHNDDARTVTLLTDDERPAVFYGSTPSDTPAFRSRPEDN